MVFVFVKIIIHATKGKKILARYENVNRRVKTFDCVSGIFRNDLILHLDYFCAPVSIAQISIEDSDELPEIEQA